MNCWRIENLIAPFLDNELPDAEAGAMADHLEQCPECSDKVEVVAALPEIVAPDLSEVSSALMDSFDECLKDRIALSESLFAGTSSSEHAAESMAWGVPSPPPAPAARPASATWLAVAAMGLLLALAGWSLFTQQRIDELEQSLAERDQLIRQLEKQVVAGRFDPRALPQTAGSEVVPVFLPASAPTPQTLPAGAFAPISYGMASIDSPRIVR
ncbi:MAG: zf-HC2 domain-containing protein [Deltaproteobacteria bacterium]|nr:zf-HC2 domain-containing protein [Deltaproteobacteria bacterium]